MFNSRFFRLAALLAAASTYLLGQTSRGTVTGLVTDPSGAHISAAEVQLKNQATGVVRTSKTNDAGLYRIDAVDPGIHDISIKSSGFKTFSSRSATVQAGQVMTLDARLEIGETATVLEVTAEGALLQTEAPVRGGNIESVKIAQLPIATRNPVSLALTIPGVSTNRFASGVSTFSVNGSRGRSNNFLLDGTENNDISITGQAFQVTNSDSVQEVAVQTTNYDAEFGRAGGAVVNVITKSGTNQLHGTASYLLDSTIDDAITNTQSLSPDIQKRGHALPGTDQWFSGTFGGKIKRDKTFFFLAFQEERQISQSTNNLQTLSAKGRATLNGLFPKGANPRVDIYNQVTGTADATSQFFNVPLGNGRPDLEFGTYILAFPQTRRNRQWATKFDHSFGPNDQLSVRYGNDNQSAPVGGAANAFPGFFTGETDVYHNVLASETHVFSPTMTNELRLHYNKILLDFPLDVQNPLGKTLLRYDFGNLAITSLGVQTNLPQGRLARNYGLQDTLTKIQGSHTFRFGFDLLAQRAKQFAPIVERGFLDYRSSGTTSYFANFVDDFGGAGPAGGSALRDFGSAAYYPKLFRQAYFFQDRWRVSSSLTLTLGVRYENFGQPINTLRTPAFTGLFNIDPLTFTGPFDKPNKVKTDNNNFGPTIGLAYAPDIQSGPLAWLFRGRKGVFRAGYQIGYDSFFNNIASNAATSSPNLVSTSVVSSVTTALPRGVANLSSLIPTAARALTPLDSQGLVVGDLVNPYMQRWSGGVQRELPHGILLDISYVGTKGTKLFQQEDLNPLVTANLVRTPQTTTPIPASRLNQRIDPLQGARSTRTNSGSSTYHALQTYVNRRFSNGLSVTTSYTWSKLLDYGSDIFTFNSNPSTTQTPSVLGGLRNDRGFSLHDRTHRATFTYLYELPWMKSQHGAVGRVAGGWKVSGVTAFESGVPLNVVNGLDADGVGGAGVDRPDFNPSGLPRTRALVDTRSPTGYVNPDDGNKPIDPKDARYIQRPGFTGSTPGRPGNAGRNTERTPGDRKSVV